MQERHRVPEVITRVGASDARLLRGHGIPTVVYGPPAENMGSIDEFVAVDDLLVLTRVHARVLIGALLEGQG